MKIKSRTPFEVFSGIISRVNVIGRFSQRFIAYMVLNPAHRKKLNKYYNQLSPAEKERFHIHYGKIFTPLYSQIFKNKKPNIVDGTWTVKFLDSEIKIPLKNESLWLDWDHAISIVGHDIEVKSTYETLLKSIYRPKIFFDVGANFGTHSLLFLTQGVSTITFEPNPICRKGFDELCQINNVEGKTEEFAVGEKSGTVELLFPEKESWLGTIVKEVKDDLSQKEGLNRMQVSLASLDDYTAKSGLRPNLIKIDTEGSEINVIKGAGKTIEAAQPIIIFESRALNEKKELWEAFQDLNYVICGLPLLSDLRAKAFEKDEFLSSKDNNFMALPKNHSIVKG